MDKEHQGALTQIRDTAEALHAVISRGSPSKKTALLLETVQPGTRGHPTARSSGPSLATVRPPCRPTRAPRLQIDSLERTPTPRLHEATPIELRTHHPQKRTPQC